LELQIINGKLQRCSNSIINIRCFAVYMALYWCK